MTRSFLALLMAAATLLAAGCQPTQPSYLLETGNEMAYYKDVATEIEYPDVESNRLAEVAGSMAPLTVLHTEKNEFWDLRLEEAVQYALANSKVMRNIGGQVLPTPTQLLRAPESARTVYDPALIETNPRLGTEAALAAFDAQFSTSMFWEKNDRPLNIAGFLSNFTNPIAEQDLGTFQAQLAKTTATGGQWFLRNNTQYEWNNNINQRLYPSAYNTNFEAEVRHPLLQGAGVQFNRIAGPNAVPGFSVFNINTGVVLARLNEDVALADFEAAVRDLTADVESAYWELYFAYRDLNANTAGRDAALQTWKRVYALYVVGGVGGEAEAEGQAREQFFLFRSQVEDALSRLYTVESRLRYMMGLASADGRLIRPADDPTTAKVRFDWVDVHNEALVRSVELRRQKWLIKRREMELIAARNFLLPRLDGVARYRWVGFGNDLIGQGNEPPFDNAFRTLFDGDFQEWQLGAQLQFTIGFRQAMSGVRNAQLQLARERAVLQEQELELVHALADSMREIDRAYTLSQTNFNRRKASQDQVNAVQAAYDTNRVTLDLLLDAQRRLAVSESAYYRSLVDYSLGIMRLHQRKGSLLEYNGVYLAEGPWPAKAYFDARKRARERDGGLYINYGYTRPQVFSRGVWDQFQGTTTGATDAPSGQPLEAVPAAPGAGNSPPAPASIIEGMPLSRAAAAPGGVQQAAHQAGPPAGRSMAGPGLRPAAAPSTMQLRRTSAPLYEPAATNTAPGTHRPPANGAWPQR